MLFQLERKLQNHVLIMLELSEHHNTVYYLTSQV